MYELILDIQNCYTKVTKICVHILLNMSVNKKMIIVVLSLKFWKHYVIK